MTTVVQQMAEKNILVTLVKFPRTRSVDCEYDKNKYASKDLDSSFFWNDKKI